MPQITRRPTDPDTRTERAPYFDIAPGLVGYEWLEVSSTADDPYPYRITARVEPEDGRYVVTTMTVERRAGGPPVQRGELGKISMEPFVIAAATEVDRVLDGERVQPIASALDPDTEQRIREHGVSDEDLPRVAAWYRWIRLQGGSPTKVLAEEFAVSAATVRRWAARAVEAGHLSQDERRK